MIELGKTFDGTVEGAISATNKLNGTWTPIQKFMTLGDFKTGISKKIDGSSFEIDEDGKNIQNYISQIAGLDEAQQNAIISATSLGDGVDETAKKLAKAVSKFSRINSRTFESALKNWDGEKILPDDIQNLMAAGGMKNGDNYALPVTKDSVDALQTYINKVADANTQNRLFNAGITELNGTNYVLTQKFKQLAGIEEAEGVVKTALTAKQEALNIAMALGKQLMASLIALGISLAATKLIEWISNLKTRSEQLIETMNSSHDAAEQAKQDVEDIQTKIDELNKTVENTGANSISDIVDPTERERLQSINDMLQAQLDLKKQLESDANNKANEDTSAVVNDKTEKSITKYHTAEDIDQNGQYFTYSEADNITKNESLQEHSQALNEAVEKRRELETEMAKLEIAGQKESQGYKDKQKELDSTNKTIDTEKDKINELSAAVSEQMGSYVTNADNFNQYKDEYVAGTNAMIEATKALANAQDNASIDTTNVDIFAEKVKTVKASMDRRGNSDSKGNPYIGAINEFHGMTGEAVLNIDADTTHQTETESAALKTLHDTADANKISFEDLIGVFETFGLLQISNASSADNYAEELEKTMSVIDNIQTAYKNCSTAVEEYNQYGYLSVDTLQSLLQMDDEYLNTLELVNGKLQINQGAYANLLEAQYAQAQMEAISQAISELNAIAKGDAAEKAETFTEATEDEKNKLVALAPALKDATVGTGELAAALAAAQDAAKGDDADAIQAKIDSVMNALNTRMSLIQSNMNAAMSGAKALKNQLGGFDNNKTSNKASKSVTDLASAFDTLKQAMEEYNKYNYLSYDTTKSLVGLEDKFTACLTKQGGELRINTAEFRKFVKEQLKAANASDDNGKSAAEMTKILGWLDSNVDSATISFAQLTDAIKGYGTAMDEAKSKTDAIKSSFSSLYSVGLNKQDNDFGFLDADSIEKQYQAVRDLYDNTSLFTNEAYANVLNPKTGEIDYESDAFKQMFADYLAQLASTARETGGEAGEYLAKGFEDAAAKISRNVISIREYIDGIGSSLERANNQIDSFQSSFSDIQDIIKEYNTYGGLSIDNYQKLMSLSDDQIKCLSLEGDQIKFNTQLYKELFVAKINAMIEKYDRADQTKALAQRLRELLAAIDKTGDGFTDANEKAKNFEDTLSNIKSLTTDLIGLFEKFNQNKSDDLKIKGDAWLDVIDKRIDALNDANDAQERAIELQKAQEELAKAQANKTVHVYSANGTGFEWEADESAVRDAQSTLNDTIRNNRKEDEIDRLNKLKDKVQEVTNLIGSSWDDYQKKLKYTAEFEKMTFDEMSGHYDSFKSSVLGNMGTTQIVTNLNTIISNVENLINTLETLNNVLTFIQTEGASTDGGGLSGLASLFNKITNKISEKGLEQTVKDGINSLMNHTSNMVESNGNNTIVKAFSKVWDAVKTGAEKVFDATESGSLGDIISGGIKNIFGKVSSWIGSAAGSSGLTNLFGNLSASGSVGATGSGLVAKVGAATGTGGLAGAATTGTTGATAATTATTASAGIPVVGAILAVAINNAVQQFSKISEDNSEIWADENASTGDKIISSLSNVLYHLSPVEGWDKAMQYSEKAANSDNLIDGLKNVLKGLYYSSGIGVTIDNIFSTVKGILGIKTKESDDDLTDSDSKKSIKDWKIWPWNWGKKDTKKDDISLSTSSMSSLIDSAKTQTTNQAKTMRDSFSSSWKSTSKETGLTNEQIDSTSAEMYKRMQNLIDQTYDSIGDTTSMSADQVEDVTKKLFESLQKIYTAGWNNLYGLSDAMSEKTAKTMNSAYESSAKAASDSLNKIQGLFKSAWPKCGGGVKDLSSNTYKELSKAWADTADDAEKMMYDVRACFDTSWGAVEQGTSNLADGTKDTLTDAWDTISSKSDEVFGSGGTLQNDTTNAWKNVEPGATNLSNNLDWVTNQAYKAMMDGCDEVVSYIKNQFNSLGDTFNATSTDTTDAKTDTSATTNKKHGVLDWIVNPLGSATDTLTKYDLNDSSKNSGLQNVVHAVTHPIENIVSATSNIFGTLFGKKKHATGLKSARSSHFANVDELGPELMVRNPAAGRYTYLETGDGVVPADITSRLFEMGGNPDAWFANQLSKYGTSQVASRSSGSMSFSTGNIIINNPVGDSNDLASEIKKNFSNKMAQEWNKR